MVVKDGHGLVDIFACFWLLRKYSRFVLRYCLWIKFKKNDSLFYGIDILLNTW